MSLSFSVRDDTPALFRLAYCLAAARALALYCVTIELCEDVEPEPLPLLTMPDRLYCTKPSVSALAPASAAESAALCRSHLTETIQPKSTAKPTMAMRNTSISAVNGTMAPRRAL